MQYPASSGNQIHSVSNFQDLVSTPFHGDVNALCWKRDLIGDFSEIVSKLETEENIVEIDIKELNNLELTTQGKLAREVILNDLKVLKENGADPILNIIKYYERDEELSFFPTDVYSFHVDRSPIPTSTFLCTYHGEASEILPNNQAVQKVMVPEIREELKKLDPGGDDFESFLKEYFFDLHYQALPDAKIINLGKGNLWRLAVDHPKSNVLPCLHRAPKEKKGESRLLLIC